MDSIRSTVFFTVGVVTSYYLYAHVFQIKSFYPPEVEDIKFGSKEDNVNVKGFKISFDTAMVADLKSRLENTRFSKPLEGVGFEYGFNLEYIREVRDYWLNKYDFKGAEAELNRYPHYKTVIAGLSIHFLRAKPPKGYATVKPLLMVHGWPGSVYEFYKVIPILTDPRNHGYPDADVAFEIVAPSLPGYGWSDAAEKKGLGSIQTARIFHLLMTRLGLTPYLAQGGDWGSITTTHLAALYPDGLIGLHVNMPYADSSALPHVGVLHFLGSILPSGLLFTPREENLTYPLRKTFMDVLQESGYFHLQATKPDTIGFALDNSPIGLAAYILEKFSTWTNKSYRSLPDGGLTKHFSMDELLTNVMIYWSTGSIGTSQRFYKEHFTQDGIDEIEKSRVLVPSGLAMYPDDLMLQPCRLLAYRFANITQCDVMDRGGHFAAFEAPQDFARNFLEFARKVVKN